MVEMELLGVQVELPFNSPTMMLRESDGGRVLPIVIDVPEAQSIGRELDGVRMARPMTHDLMASVLGLLETELRRVVVTELRDRTFHAELVLDTNGVERRISSRPSDAIALAVRTGAPIFASEDVLSAAGQYVEPADEHPDDILAGEVDELPEDDADPDELMDEFKQFLDEINPEDFDG